MSQNLGTLAVVFCITISLIAKRFCILSCASFLCYCPIYNICCLYLVSICMFLILNDLSGKCFSHFITSGDSLSCIRSRKWQLVPLCRCICLFCYFSILLNCSSMVWASHCSLPFLSVINFTVLGASLFVPLIIISSCPILFTTVWCNDESLHSIYNCLSSSLFSLHSLFWESATYVGRSIFKSLSQASILFTSGCLLCDCSCHQLSVSLVALFTRCCFIPCMYLIQRPTFSFHILCSFC